MFLIFNFFWEILSSNVIGALLWFVSRSLLSHPPFGVSMYILALFSWKLWFQHWGPGDIGSSCSWTRSLRVGEEERCPCDAWAQGCQNQRMRDGPAETTLTTHTSFKRPKVTGVLCDRLLHLFRFYIVRWLPKKFEVICLFVNYFIWPINLKIFFSECF